MLIRRLKFLLRIRTIKKLLGMGPQLLLLSFSMEGLTIISRQWLAFPVRLDMETRILWTIPCAAVCFFGIVWINRYLFTKRWIVYNKTTQGEMNHVF